MISALIALQIVTLAALIVLLLRRNSAAPTVEDPRLNHLLACDLPAQFTRLDARSQSFEEHLRAELAQFRADSASASAALRTEVLNSVNTLGNTLRTELLQKLDAARQQNETAAESLRSRVQEGLQQLSTNNEKKLEEMRLTVDEKLHQTLQTRLTESFGQVTDQLTKVHAGLGEMSKLSAGVNDLSRIFTNVKSRGGFAEVQLGMLLQQMLAPSQFQQNVRVKPNTQELVEYAVRFPTPHGDTLMPVDSKFNKDAWERLETAYAGGSTSEITSAAKQFEAAIRVEARRISEKYISPPTTTSFAVMFLPTEGIYAEVMRRDGLQSDIQQNFRVTIAGPSTLSAILNSFQMGFHMLELQQKGDEVWKVLANARTQFGKFEDLMTKMDDQVSKVQRTIQDVGTRTRAINRTLRDVSVDADQTSLPSASSAAFGTHIPLLPAHEDE